MPLPSPIPPLLPKPDVQEDINSALKKAGLLAGGIGLTYAFNPKFPEFTRKASHFVFGFEPKPPPSRSILIKPAFVVTVFPEPIGAVPPSVSGLPRYTADLKSYYSISAAKEGMKRDQRAFIDESFKKTMELVEGSRDSFQNRPIEFVETVRDNSKRALDQLGPRHIGPAIIRHVAGDIDSRVFYAVMQAEAEAELDRRREIFGQIVEMVPGEKRVQLLTRKYNLVDVQGTDLGDGLPGVLFPDKAFAANPPDP